MKILLAASVATSLFIGIAIAAVYYLSVLQTTEATYQSLVENLRAENIRLQNLLTDATNEASRLQSDLRNLQSLLEKAEQRARQFSERAELLDKQVGDLSSQLNSARKELEDLRSKVNQVRDILTLLENDRVLLSWIRAEPPLDRESARRFWNETRALAERSDPSLALSVDKILANLDLYFDWLDKFPRPTGTSREELVAWCPLYIDWILTAPPGVDEYINAITQFQQEVFLVIIGHIDSLLSILEG